MQAKTATAKINRNNPFVNFFRSIGDWFANFGKMLIDGSVGTKLSYLIFGAGSFYHKQWIKGLIYFLVQCAFVAFMIFCPEVNHTPFGYKALINLKLGGFEGGEFDPITGTITLASNTRLYLLFGIVTIAICILYIIVWISNIQSSYKADLDMKKGLKPSTFKEDCAQLLDSKFHTLMLTPTCIAALVFTLLPTIFMICIAFTTYNDFDMNALETKLFYWSGLENFQKMFTGTGKLGREIHDRFFPVLGWTMIWAILATFTCYFGGIILAILINKKGIKGKKIFRTIFILTIAIPQFISLLAMRNLLSGAGPVNKLIMDLGISDKPIGFLGLNAVGDDPNLAKFMVIIINMWVGIPYTMLMTSGILMNIPTDLYEAARVDGAGRIKQFFKITFPYIFFITTPYLISSFIGNINSFNTIFLLTGGGPSVPGKTYVAGQTDLLVTWLYKLTIDNKEYNTGAVIGILTFLITATITLITYRRSKTYKEEDTFQ